LFFTEENHVKDYFNLINVIMGCVTWSRTKQSQEKGKERKEEEKE